MNVVKVVAIILVALGAIVSLGFIFHDLLLDPHNFRLYFGRKEITGVAIGAIVFVLGLILLLHKTSL